MQSQLAKHQLSKGLTDDELHDLARKAYHIKSMVLVKLEELSDPYIKQEIINYADRKYGKK